MNKNISKKFINAVLRKCSSLRFVNGVFYSDGNADILSGFYCEKMRSGFAIYLLAMPMYIKADNIVLHYSKYLSQNDRYLEYLPGEEDFSAEVFFQKTKAYGDEVEELKKVDFFAKYLDTFWNEDPVIIKAKFMSFAFLGQYGRADALIDVMKKLKYDLDDEFIKEVYIVLRAYTENKDRAAIEEIFLNNKIYTKRAVGLM